VKDDRLTEQQHLEVCEALQRHEARVARTLHEQKRSCYGMSTAR
jgi:hypothetical protein